MGLLKEFKEFAVKGNMIDMAVGVIIGGAFSKIVEAFIKEVVMPPLSLLRSGDNANLSLLNLELRPKVGDQAAVMLNLGAFMGQVLDFVIMAFVVFIFIKQMNRLKRKEAVAPSDPTDKLCPECQMTIPIKAKRCGHCATQLVS
jgi:large conductance mechanosensitive channel